jgi:hypothetical protein
MTWPPFDVDGQKRKKPGFLPGRPDENNPLGPPLSMTQLGNFNRRSVFL